MSSFGYTNARVRAWKSKLLDNAFYEKLLTAKDLSAVNVLLGKTDYQKDIEKGSIKYRGVSGIEEGLRQNLTNKLHQLFQIVSNDAEAEKLVGIILSRWDVYNLKTVLRGLHSSSTEEEIIEQLMPIASFDEAALRTLVKQPNMKMTISQLIFLSPQYAKPLQDGFKDYEKTGNLSKLELNLDKEYFRSVLDQTSKGSENALVVNSAIKREIDTINLMTLIRLNIESIQETFNVSDYFLEGGSIKTSNLIELLKLKDMKDIIEGLKRSEYYEFLKKGFEGYKKNVSLSSVERALEDYVIHKNIALFRADPLSIGTVVAYISAKVNEVINIRIVLRGKEVEMQPEDIKEALVLV